MVRSSFGIIAITGSIIVLSSSVLLVADRLGGGGKDIIDLYFVVCSVFGWVLTVAGMTALLIYDWRGKRDGS